MKNLRRHGESSHYLPEELTTQILEKLPIKSLVQCMCVHKSWYHLIKSPPFVTSHLNYQKTHHKYLLLRSDDDQTVPLTLRVDHARRKEYSLLPYHPDLPPDPSWYGVSNGLLCFTSTVMKDIRYNCQVSLWNPAIRKLRTLPDPPRPSFPRSKPCVRLAFGFCPKVNDFKVVKIINYSWRGNSITVADVYSLTTDSWKTINNLVFTHQFGDTDDWVFLNGTAFFTSLTVNKECIIVCYDTDKDILRVISLPETCSFGCSLQVFGKSVVIFIRQPHSSGCFNMWVLNDGGINEVRWEEQISIHLDGIGNGNWEVVGMRNNVEVLVLNNHILHGHMLVSYNVKNNKQKWFGWVTRTFRINIFTESLVMINA